MRAYNRARSLALLLTVGTNREGAKIFQLLVDALNAEKIDFGSNPQTPAEQAVEAAKLFVKKDEEKK